MSPRSTFSGLALLSLALLGGAPSSAAPQDATAEEHFRERVLPILEGRCFECHGPHATRIRGKLRMSGREALLAGGASGPSIVPGEPDASLLVQAVRHADPDLAMPPKERLPAEEIAALEAWVAAGAPWPAPAPDPAAELFDHAALQFFEDEVRPLLARHCAECHGAMVQRKSGLGVHSRAALLAGGDRGPAIVPGDPGSSLLLRAVGYGDPGLQMPPQGKLAAEEIAVLERWIAIGAPWPAESVEAVREEQGIDVEAGRSFWSFRPVQRPEVPKVQRVDLVRNPIDAFVLARLEEAGLEPNPPAGEAELVRRAFVGLIGLPPERADIERYRADPAPDKWERLVDELLARPEYGQRWGRHWLDVVRFAQTNGYERDAEKPYTWRYRDWVIESIAADKPFDRFLAEQLAGDELEGAGPEALVATGFHHLGAFDSEPDDKEQAVEDGYDDVLRTIGEGMLGLSISCARCHDHKFDPIRQRDYYGMLAFVRQVRPYKKPEYSLDSETYALTAYDDEIAGRWERERAEHQRSLEAKQAELRLTRRKQLVAEIVAGQSPDVRAAYAKPPAERSPDERKLLASLAHLQPSDADVEAALTDRDRQQLFLLKEEAERSANSFAGSLPWALVAREAGPEPVPTRLLGRGRVGTPLEVVEPAFLPVLCASDEAARPAPAPRPAGARSTGLRRALAEWITSPDHPTTARVIANRVWLHHFGRGIVRTPNDFGSTGAPPTHPELLDWLASELVRQGWSLKALHRTVLGSYAYRMSSVAANERALAKDPANDLFWRQERRRFDAEVLRDAMLAAGGRLSSARGGRGFFPELQREALAGASKPGDGWELSEESERDRRAVYAFVKRGMLAPMLELFDFADPTQPIGLRPRTTIASQALTLLNSDFTSRAARALAERVRASAGADVGARVQALFELALARAPEPEELALALAHLERMERGFAGLEPSFVLRAKLPARLQTKFLSSLAGSDLLHGPGEGWQYVRGRFGSYYNDTLEREPGLGPAALLSEPRFQDGAVRLRLRLDPGCELAGLLVRARPSGDELEGLELALDPLAARARLLHQGGPGVEPAVLAERALQLEFGRWYELELEARGALLRARLDGEELLVTQSAPLLGAGSFALRTFGDSLEVADLALLHAGERVSVLPRTMPPAERAFEALCLAVLNLDEFSSVD